ncbi:MAG: TMEM175 family protein [Candidatus Eremiobacteraeota bacterium]|nr:TMEM175 family protein [Candidatus Eremiobacteraeota bacterium]
MSDEDKREKNYWLTTTRLESLADNVFAFAMTLLVLNLVLPDVPRECTFAAIVAMFQNLWPHLNAFAMSFIVLAIFWMLHHKQFFLINRVDGVILWNNVFIMMFVVLVPFATQFSAKHDGVQAAELVLDANLFILGVLFFINWWYATYNHRLVDPGLDSKTIRRGLMKTLFMPGLALIAMGLSFFHASLSSTIYIFLPLILYDFLKS